MSILNRFWQGVTFLTIAFVLVSTEIGYANKYSWILKALYETSKDVAAKVLSDQITKTDDTKVIRAEIMALGRRLDNERQSGAINDDDYQYGKSLEREIRKSLDFLEAESKKNRSRIEGVEARLQRVEQVILAGTTLPQASYYEPYFPKYQTSFDCSKSRTTSEKILCTHFGASQADIVLGQTYAETMARILPDQQSYLRKIQIAWIRGRDDICGSKRVEFEKSDPEIKDIIGGCLEKHTLYRTDFLRSY